MKKTFVTLNYANCLSDYVGSQGLNIADLQSMTPVASTAWARVAEKKNAKKIGYHELPLQVKLADEIVKFMACYKNKFDNFAVAGIGGSALGNIALHQALRHPYWNLLTSKQRNGWLRLFVLDNVDPVFISGLLDAVDLKKTVVNVISKAGTTAECLSSYFYLKSKIVAKVGKKNYRKHIIVTTDANTGYLRELAKTEGLASFVIPSNVGGRFSGLTPVGLLSAAAAGIDIHALLRGAKDMETRCGTDDMFKNPALMYAATQYLFYQKGKRINVMFPYSNQLYGIADWFRQLWAESLGKEKDNNGKIVNVGPTPVKALGVTDQHSQVQLYIEGPYDKVITFLSVEDFGEKVVIPKNVDPKHYLSGYTFNELLKAEEDATRLALTKKQRANCTINLPKISPYHIGQVLLMLENATAYAGELFNINTFDQPGVVAGKEMTYALMGRPGYEKEHASISAEVKKSKQCRYTV
ncbi:MAG: glucose-6-phosphate isomerase [Elusimicrobiota bacterium]